MGDFLIVTVTPDRFVDKGPHRPVFNEDLRSEAIASLDTVDCVAINEWPTAEETLRLLRPDIYVKGSEFRNTEDDITGKMAREEAVISEIGAVLAFTDDIVFSSSNLINRYLADYTEEMTEYLQLFRTRYSIAEILSVLDLMRSAKVLVVGDSIIDEYQYCDPLGASSKDPVLAMKYRSHDQFAGGALAIANHVSGFAGSVDLMTVLGGRHTYEEFIRDQLEKSITPHFIVSPAGHTVVKRRYVDEYTLNKLFEIYVIDDSDMPSEQVSEAVHWLGENLPKYDLVIAADFGHGAIMRPMRQTLADTSRFLAVMTQANAGNRGFHTISSYTRADYVCLAEHEIRLETRDIDGDLRPSMTELTDKMRSSCFVVTRGRRGCLVSGSKAGFLEVPAFAHNIVDRIGAGDAFFSVTSLAACQGVSTEILGFLGNAAGALAVGIVGNKKSIGKSSITRFITALMK